MHSLWIELLKLQIGFVVTNDDAHRGLIHDDGCRQANMIVVILPQLFQETVIGAPHKERHGVAHIGDYDEIFQHRHRRNEELQIWITDQYNKDTDSNHSFKLRDVHTCAK